VFKTCLCNSIPVLLLLLLLFPAGKSPRKAAAGLQSRVLQGMRYKVLLNLAPLLGSTPEALQTWCAALSHNPSNPKIWEEASLVLAQLGHLQLAVYAAGAALRLSPDSVLLLERLVAMLAGLQDWRGAAGVLLELRRVTGGWHPW
jgi:tetratricopeptide (TPR) repeat protein